MNKKTITLLTILMLTPVLFVATSANAAGVDDRVDIRQDRRGDAADNASQGAADRQDFREERRDCTGEGADCRQDNRHEKVEDSADRADSRQNNRSNRMNQR